MKNYLFRIARYFVEDTNKYKRYGSMAILSIICGDVFFGERMHNLLKRIVLSIPNEINPWFRPILGSLTAFLIIFLLYKNMEKYIRLLNNALRDSLTGLYNRSFLEDAIHLTMAKSIRNEEKFCVFNIDINNLKHINDKHGHYIGNDAIVVIASVIEKVVYRREDFILRIGGDEIEVICSTKDHQAMFSRILKSMSEENIQFYVGNKRIHLSASVGTSCMDVSKKKLSYAEEKLLYDKVSKEADENMYKHKNSIK